MAERFAGCFPPLMGVPLHRRCPSTDDIVERRRRTTAVLRAWSSAFAATLLVGALALHRAVGGLRGAHLYRQRTGEGLEFTHVGIWLVVANGLLAAAAFAAVHLASHMRGVTHRRTLVASVVAIVATLAAADLLALWVESHGDRCIGPCG